MKVNYMLNALHIQQIKLNVYISRYKSFTCSHFIIIFIGKIKQPNYISNSLVVIPHKHLISFLLSGNLRNCNVNTLIEIALLNQ